MSVSGTIYDLCTQNSIKFTMPLNFGITKDGNFVNSHDIKKDVSITVFTKNNEIKIGIYDPIGNIIKRSIKELNNKEFIGFGTRCQCVIHYDNEVPTQLYVNNKLIMINNIDINYESKDINPQFVCNKVLLYF